jgi:predicted metalloprotease with PDZ domain
MLDLEIRGATDGRRSMDDVMRLMFERFGGTQGFTGRDVERAVEDVCSCDVTGFFDAHVRAGSAITFDRYLAHIGLRSNVEWVPATNQNGEPIVDLRVYAADVPAGQLARLVVSNPNTPWAKAGLHTGDRIVTVNGAPARSWMEFRRILQRIRVGDTTRVEVERAGKRLTVNVVNAQQMRPLVRLEQIAGAPASAARLRTEWEYGR